MMPIYFIPAFLIAMAGVFSYAYLGIAAGANLEKQIPDRARKYSFSKLIISWPVLLYIYRRELKWIR